MPGEIPSGWSETTLGRIASESRERCDPTLSREVGLPYVGLEHIDPRSARVVVYGAAEEVTSQKTRFLAGDILFGKLRPYLKKVAHVDRDGICSTDILAIRPRDDVDRGFLFTVLTRDETIQHATGTSAGTKMPRTSWSSLAELAVLVPPLPEQRKIAAILSSVDDAIQATQAIIDQTRRVKEGLLQDLLAPRPDWRERRLGDLIEEQGGEIKTGPFGTVLRADEQDDNGVPLVSVKEIRDGYITVDHDTPRVPQKVTSRLSDFVLAVGDIVFARKRAVDRCAVVYEAEAGWMLGSDAIRVRVPKSIRPRFAAVVFQTPRVRSFILDRSVGSTSMVTLSQRTLAAIPFPVVSAEIQDFVVGRLEAIDGVVRALVIEQSRLQRAKVGLLQDLLTGKVRVAA